MPDFDVKKFETHLELPRRNFVVGALLSGAVLFSNIKVNAASIEETAGFVTPTPADALVDFLDFFHDIGSGILRPYYKLVGIFAQKVSSRYSELKRVTKEFVALVPELKGSFDISRLQSIAEIGKLAASYVEGTPTENGVRLIANHTSLVRMTSNDLKNIAVNYELRDNSITLSPEAEAKLRELLKLIADLNKPVEGMDEAAAELTRVSNGLDGDIKKSTAFIREAIRILVAAEIIESPPDSKTLAIVIKSLSEKTPSYPTSAAALREMAATKVDAAKENLVIVISTFKISPKLQELLDKAEEKVKEEIVKASKTESVSADVLQNLLVGVAGWIRNPKLSSLRENSEIGSNVRYISAGLTNSAVSIGDLWRNIRAILVELIPQATSRRTYQLWWRKMCACVHPYSVQYGIFYHTLLNLDEPNDVDLRANERRRREAADRLARLNL